MNRVLLTGGSGFLGAHVLRLLLNETAAHVVLPVTFAHKGVPERLSYAVRDDQWDRVTVVRQDLMGPVNPTTARLFGDVDTILNLASDTHPPRSVQQPVEFVNTNVGIALNLLEYARTLPDLEAFVQVSTDAVYGPAADGVTHVEWNPIIPANPYAASKAAQEALGMAWWRSFGVPVMIAATMNPLGETQDGEKFIPMTIGKILRGETVTVHANARGEVGGRTYIDADEVAAGLLFLVTKQPPVRFGAAATRPDRWNVCGTTELSNQDVVEAIADALGEPLDMEIVPQTDRPEHGHRYAMSGAKLADVGWVPSGAIRDALRRTVLWTRDNPLWLQT